MALQFSPTESNMATVKLGADLYEVEDIHGVTEGLTGSGNLNYLVLQSGQTDEMRRTADPFDIRQGNLWFPEGNLSSLGANPHGLQQVGLGDAYGTNPAYDANDRGGNHLINGGLDSRSSTSTFDSLNSYISATDHDSSRLDIQNSSNRELSGVFETIRGNGNDGINGNDGNGHDGTDGRDGRDGKDGVSPEPPHDPPTPDPDPVPDSDTDLNVHLNDGLINGNIGVLLDPVEKLVGDIDIDINNSLDLSPVLTGNLPNIGLGIDALLLGTHLPLINTAPILNPVTDNVNGLLDTLHPITVPVLDTVTSLLPDQVTDILSGMNSDGDHDLVLNLGDNILNLPLIQGSLEIPLDLLESITGDIDLTLSPDLTLLSNGTLAGLGLGGVFNGAALPELQIPDLLNTVGETDSLLNTVIDQSQGLDGGLLDPLAAPVDFVQDGIGALADPLDDVLNPVLQPVADLLDPLQNLGGHGSDILNGLIDNIDDASNIENDIAGTLDPVGDLLGGMQDQLADVGHILDQPFDALDQVGTAVADIASPVIDALLNDNDNPGDTDLTIHTGIEATDVITGIVAGAVNLDPVEAVTGDIDIDISAGLSALTGGANAGALADTIIHVDPAEGLLNELADNLLGALTGDGSGQGSTPHALDLPVIDAGAGIGAGAGLPLPTVHGTDSLSDLAQTVQGTVGAVTGGAALPGGAQVPTLPDPVGHLAEGLSGVVDHGHGAVHHALGGLFG
jgi:hypothetical protein